MKSSTSPCVLLTMIFAVPFVAAAVDWPGWRGADGTGASSEKGFPLKWSPTENVRWRVDLPERGNSSPIVWGDRVFVSQAISGENRRTLMCFDRTNGKLLWQSGITYADREPTQRENPYCSATPATDGERVVVSFGSAGLYCYDFAGKELWHRDFGKMNHMFGNASSPVLAGDLCVYAFGPDEKARLIAVNKKTGENAWELQQPKVDASEQAPMRGGPGVGGGGRGGFGPGRMLGPQMVSQGDKDGDGKLNAAEFASLADAWFDKLDTDKAGKLDQQTFTDRLANVLPAPQGFGRRDDADENAGDRPGGRRGGFSPGRFLGPGLFAAADSDKDNWLTREELKGTFAKWFGDWDKTKIGVLDEAALSEGLSVALPRPQFGGPGGPGGGGGGGGRGGPGGGGGPGGSWSTPLLIKAGDHDELVMSFPSRVVACDPKTGKELWSSKGIGGTVYSSPLWGEGMLVAMSSGMGGGNAIALKAGGSGDVTESQRLWRLERVKSGIGSGVIRDGHLYTVSQEGIATCLDLRTGDTVWEERLKGTGSRGGSWSSLLLSDDRIYAPNQAGDVFVLRAAPKFEVLATNSVGEPTNASLAASNGELFLRTEKSLWCFAEGK